MLGAAELSSAAPLFATGLAYKVLGVPERGWRRNPADIAAAALFAGLDEPAPNSSIAEFARGATDFLPALHLVIVADLARGHEAGQPLLLRAISECGWFLVEAEGVFPIARSGDCAGLFAVIDRFARPVILVPADSVAGNVLDRLDAGGYRFITDAPPTRGERWRPLRRPPAERWWTNDAVASERSLVASARKLAMSSQAFQGCWEEMMLRPSVAPGNAEALETSLSLAASVALADISWTLWKSDGNTDPLLAIERFGDLDARVHFRPDEVVVKLPLGKRSADLAAHGILGDVAGVPWYEGRVVRFSGGSPW